MTRPYVLFFVFGIFVCFFAFGGSLSAQETDTISYPTASAPGGQLYDSEKYGQQPAGLEQQSTEREQQRFVQPETVPEKRTRTEQRQREETSEFEKYISSKAVGTTIINIKQFGYDLFENPPSTFAPVQHVPVGPDYVAGPGDAIKIDVWGKIEGTWNVKVDNDGNVRLPKIGVVGVTGLTFSELKDLLLKEFSKYYTGFEMNVSMGPLRTVTVYVVGNAKRPGVYTVSSLSTVINALFAGGGPSKTGSMRNIQVKRNGRTVVTFDLYDFLLQGDKTHDIRLMPEDVIFIPPVGAIAGIAGNVKTPAIYELKGETRLRDLIKMAGGITGIAFTGRVQIHRIEDHHFRTVFEGDLIDIEKNVEKNFILHDAGSGADLHGNGPLENRHDHRSRFISR